MEIRAIFKKKIIFILLRAYLFECTWFASKVLPLPRYTARRPGVGIFIPDIKPPSRFGIYYRSRLDDVAARALTPPDPIKSKPCECGNNFKSPRSSRFLYVLQVQRFWLLLTTSFPRSQATMLSKFVFSSRYSRLVVFALCLLVSNTRPVAVSLAFKLLIIVIRDNIVEGAKSNKESAKSKTSSSPELNCYHKASLTSWERINTA